MFLQSENGYENIFPCSIINESGSGSFLKPGICHLITYGNSKRTFHVIS